ncbi:ras-associated and pleckstrin homology domains-containing protein 1-like isoform X2 [Sinocyclocheilus anshuiensis]|uniref:ras-associated and pleckstrin homology domains-containing protein 1-like isoform X2 n=1 Tax=Sinocyclocheilus anshuiensis TaxID=1608454 RepID=UPI0007B8D8AF|nr:PREDICTED: ras-associated and pleckstrin homology domains-containing protein 1-like isoform X2 [Sinocyclocheilus anshuiensis]
MHGQASHLIEGTRSRNLEHSSGSQPDENAYQSDDSGWMKLQPLWGQVYGLNTLHTSRVEGLLGMKPKVDCVGDSMRLTIHGREAPFGSNFLIDRGSVPPLPLSQLPSECGHRFLRTWRDFVLIIPYDGCYVMHERDTFVLPLLWWGLHVKMSCSSLTSAKSEPTVSCYTNGMIVRLLGGVSEKLKIKVMNEWQPLLKVSARCGYSLVSHPEGVVIHAPYMPCTEPKDGMFTLSMAVESEFNMSCPALSLSLPIDTTDFVHENESISIPHALTSTTTITTTTKTTQPRQTPASRSTTSTSSIQKLPTPLLPYYIPGQPDFKPIPPRYPLLLFPPNIPPTILPQGPKIVGPPTAITQRPQAPVYTKRPQTWYPKPSLGLPCDPTHQSAAGPPYPKKPLLHPTKAPTAPIAPLLKPTDSPQDKLPFTVPIVPPVQWAPMFPPSNMVYPLYPGKPEFVASSSAVFPQVPYWPNHSLMRPSEPHASPKPEPEPLTPAPTRKTGPQLLRYPWYKPFPPRRSEMPPVPKNNMVSTSGAVASMSATYSERSEQVEKPQASELPCGTVVKGPPMNLHFDLTPNTYPTPSLPKFPKVVHTPAPIEASPTPINLSHAHSFHCPAFCPGPPSMFYHHHNHHHFGHPFQMSNFDISSTTKITGQMLSSIISPDSNLFSLIKGKGYNYGPLYTKTALPPASDHTAMQYLVENPTIKSTDAPDTSKHFTGPTMRPYIFRKLESTAASPQPTMNPANVASVIRHLEHSQNRPVVEPLAYSNRSPNPAVNQAEMQQYVSPLGRDTQPMLVAPNNGPTFEKMFQHDISSKPTMPPTHSKNAFMNYWHQAANLNAKLPRCNSLTKDSFTQMSLPQPPNNHNPFEPSTASLQPEETPGKNPPPQLSFHPLMQIRNSVPVKNHQLYFPPNGESVDPFFRGPKLFNTH